MPLPRVTTACPNFVRFAPLAVRCTKGTLNSSSKADKLLLNAGCVNPRRRAAARTLPVSAMATKACI